MITGDDVFKFLNRLAPIETQESYDNAGFLVGNPKAETKRVLLSLDATRDVIEEAIQQNCDLIITHHPVIWGKFHQLLSDDLTGRKLIELVKHNLSVISMHTNLDAADDGVNDVLIRILGAETVETVSEEPALRIGTLSNSLAFDLYLHQCKKALKTNGLRYVSSGKPVFKIGCVGGAGDFALSLAKEHGCDTFITSDIHYNVFLDAIEMGMNLIDGDHFCTENPIMNHIMTKLSKEFPEVKFILSKKHHQVISFY